MGIKFSLSVPSTCSARILCFSSHLRPLFSALFIWSLLLHHAPRSPSPIFIFQSHFPCFFSLHVSMSCCKCRCPGFLAGSAGPWFLVPGVLSRSLQFSKCRLAIIFPPTPQVLLLPSSCLPGDDLRVSILKQTVFFS